MVSGGGGKKGGEPRPLVIGREVAISQLSDHSSRSLPPALNACCCGAAGASHRPLKNTFEDICIAASIHTYIERDIDISDQKRNKGVILATSKNRPDDITVEAIPWTSAAFGSEVCPRRSRCRPTTRELSLLMLSKERKCLYPPSHSQPIRL